MMVFRFEVSWQKLFSPRAFQEMASALKMNYAYAVEFLELTKGNSSERDICIDEENEWGYHLDRDTQRRIWNFAG